MARKVKCPYCNEWFLREEKDFILLPNGRYAHKKCVDTLGQKDKIKNKIHQKISSLCKEQYSKQKVTKQINSYLKEGKSEIGILRALEYWYDIKKGDPAKANGGIGIVSYIYGEAAEYFSQQEQLKNINKNIRLSDYILEDKKITISPQAIKKPKRIKLFELD